METNPTVEIHSTTKHNILHKMIDKGLKQNALAINAGIPSTTFDRKLKHPEQFTLKDLGSIAQALDIELKDLFKDAA